MQYQQLKELPANFLHMKYEQYRNVMVMQNNTIKFIVGYTILGYYLISDFINYHSDLLLYTRLLPFVTLSVFVIFQYTWFKRDNRYAVLVYNTFLISLLVMNYVNLLFFRHPEFDAAIASKTLIVLAVVGFDARGNWFSIFLLQAIPTALFFYFAWFLGGISSSISTILFAHIVTLIALNVIIGETKNRILYESFIREQNFQLEQSKNHLLIKQLTETNNLIEEQKEEIQSQKEEIVAQNEEISSQRDFAERQRDMIIAQKDELTDSIVYARRIQMAMLPDIAIVKRNTADSMLLFMPKDIVSGDFYWATELDNFLIFCVADCTGHGVPGGFMSMLGISFLNEIVSKHRQKIPNLILHNLRETVISSLNQRDIVGSSNDGMDIAMVCIDKNSRRLYFSGANNSLIIFRATETEPIEIKGDKMPIAIYPRMREFTLQSIDLKTDDALYLFTDGFADQFGGPKGKKFMMKNFKKLLGDIHFMPMDEQRVILSNSIKQWMRGHEKQRSAVNAQIDDITVLGIRI